MTSPSSVTDTHILIFPYPAQGHIIPLLDFTNHLLTHGATALTITVVITAGNHHLLQPLLSHHPPTAISTLILPFPHHPLLPSGAENHQDLPPDSFVPVMSCLRRLRKPLLHWFTTHPSPPSVIISDMFLGWTNRLAEQLSIKRIVFSPSGALYLAVVHSLWKNVILTPKPDENGVVSIDDIPGQPKFPWYQLSGLYRAYATGDPDSEFLRSEFMANMESYGFVVNTFKKLEESYLDHMMSDLGHNRIWAVGPLLPPESDVGYGLRVRGGSSSGEEDVLKWLDGCGEANVVYVSFGSQGYLTHDMMEVLAFGLERSGVRFVWKIKEPTHGHVDGERFAKLPTGFEDRVAPRGLVIRGWAPQVLILRHKAVGAFLTHCGWNSVLEGLSAGIMTLTWPLGADQYANAILLVDKLKVGVRVGSGSRSLPDPDELARILADSLTGAYKEFKSRALELNNMAKEAISKGGGSSSMDLDCLVQHLSILPKPDADVLRRCGRWLEEQEVVGHLDR